MDKTTFKILETLSRDLTSPISINELTNRIREIHGTAYYKNIYEKIQDLKKRKTLTLSEIGKASTITLNFSDYKTTDLLSEIELTKKEKLLEKRTEPQLIFLEMEKLLQKINYLQFAIIIRPEKNLKLNRIELLLILIDSTEKTEQTIKINSMIEELGKKHNMRIDTLAIEEKGFLELLQSEETNPLKEMFWDKIAFFSPQKFWLIIRTALESGFRIRSEKEEFNPTKIAEKDLIYNLSRFGYKELGYKIEKGKNICAEYLITSAILKEDMRRIYAIPVIMVKNKINYNLLIFLCEKYQKTRELFGLLKILNKIKENKDMNEAIRILKSMKIKEIEFNEETVRNNLRLYNAI